MSQNYQQKSSAQVQTRQRGAPNHSPRENHMEVETRKGKETALWDHSWGGRKWEDNWGESKEGAENRGTAKETIHKTKRQPTKW